MLSPEEGNFLLKLARKAIKTYLTQNALIKAPSDTPALLKEEMGAFVTLLNKGDLRGCIGYPEPIKPLVNAVIEVAISAATGDPRFQPVRLEELDGIEIEVSVLTKPEVIEVKKPRDYLDMIKIGEDGLIVEMGIYRGLLLPQVPVEWQWNVEEFLCNTCMKAGLSPDCWLQEGVKIYKFKTQIFGE
jgi:uncharacterized protein